MFWRPPLPAGLYPLFMVSGPTSETFRSGQCLSFFPGVFYVEAVFFWQSLSLGPNSAWSPFHCKRRIDCFIQGFFLVRRGYRLPFFPRFTDSSVVPFRSTDRTGFAHFEKFFGHC